MGGCGQREGSHTSGKGIPAQDEIRSIGRTHRGVDVKTQTRMHHHLPHFVQRRLQTITTITSITYDHS